MKRSATHILLLLLLVSPSACHDGQAVRYESVPARFDVDGAAVALLMPPLSQVRDDLLTLIVNMEGMEGVLSLLEGATGLDVTRADFLAQAALAADVAPVLWGGSGNWFLGFGVTDGADFLAFVRELAGQEAWDFVETRTTEGPVLVALSESLCLAVDGNLGVVHRGVGDEPCARLARVLLAAAPTEPASLPEKGYAFRLRRTNGRTVEGDLADAFGSLGLLAGGGRALARYLDSCTEFTGRFTLSDRILLSVASRGCHLPVVSELALVPEQVLADDTIFALQTRVAGESLWKSLPGLVRMLLESGWHELPGKRPDGLVDLADLVGRFEPELALAFLGFSPTATMESFVHAAGVTEPLFALHLQAILRLREGERVDELLDPQAMATLFAGFVGRGIGAGDVVGTEYCRESKKEGTHCFALLVRDRTVMAVTGVGEGERLVRTLRQQRKSLKDALFARQTRGGVTLTLKTRRLIKDLASKGFPPYFLQILSSILEVRVTASDSESGTAIQCEVVLR